MKESQNLFFRNIGKTSKNAVTSFITKTLTIIFLLAVITISFVIVGFSGQMGDIDGNGKISSADARLVLRHSAKIDILDNDILVFADANSDNKITSADARIILRVAAKLQEFDVKEPETSTTTEPVSTEETTTEKDETTEHIHDYYLTDSKKGTCTSTGINTYSCKTCNDTYNSDTPMTYHSAPYGKCESCSQEINDMQIQLAIAEHKYETGLEDLVSSHEASVDTIKRKVKAYMETAGVTVLYSSDYYIQLIETLNNEIAILENKALSNSAYNSQLSKKINECSEAKLLLEAAQLMESIDSKDLAYSKELSAYEENYLKVIEKIKADCDPIKCMICLEVMEKTSKDGFCDKCRIILDEKTIKIAEENTRYYNCQIELYVKYLIDLNNAENLNDEYSDLLKPLGFNSLEDMVKYINANPGMIQFFVNTLKIPEEELNKILNAASNYKELYKEELTKELNKLKDEHISILNTIEKNFN